MQFWYKILTAVVFLFIGTFAYGQGDLFVPETKVQADPLHSDVSPDKPVQKVVILTGVRFSYPLVQHWIDQYTLLNPSVQIIIESRGSADPAQYDILAEVFEHDADTKRNREYLNVGRYAIIPVATSGSTFAKFYSEKGLNKDAINHVFFHNIFADKERKSVNAPFTVYTRLQKAGVPTVFARYFGYEQKDIKGTAIAGADSHLVKALLRDSAGVTYLPLSLVYDVTTRKPIESVTVLPVDLNGNKKVSDEEKFYGSLDNVIQRLENIQPSEIQNIPIGVLHLSIDRQTASAEAVDFLKWVHENGQKDLHDFGYLNPESKSVETSMFEDSSGKKGE